ncbi:MAG: hypothetical protein BWY63_00346 [Chloroflexi bacterium ADurb.Bin360]|nr:MAG: hypothetical protein BWY63_00346 [Chloroflexi bacterium ADurb.Bin360]
MNFLLVFGIGTVLLGLVFVILALVGRHRHEAVGDWPTVPGKVLSRTVQRFQPRPGQKAEIRYTPLVTYTYEVAGQAFTAQKLDFKPPKSYATAAEAEEVVIAYPVGSEVKVTHNPLGPQQAALDRGRPVGYNTELVSGLLLILCGAVMIVVTVLL